MKVLRYVFSGCLGLSLSAAGLMAMAASDGPPARGDDAKRNSKNGRLEAEVGGVDVVVTYGRPKVKGRSLWGDLVPHGKVWRTGADEATTLTLAAPAKIEGQVVEPGTYALFTIPNEKGWTVILNTQAKQWGAYKYDSDKDAVRVQVEPTQGDHVEALTFTADEGHLRLHWGKKVVPIRIQKAG